MKLLPLVIIFISSCSISRYNSEGGNIKSGGEIAKDCQKVIHVKKIKTMLGYKHTMVNEKRDTSYHYFEYKLKLDSCYNFLNKMK